MSQPDQNEDETLVETQAEETQYIETQVLEPGNIQKDEGVVAPPGKGKKTEKKEPLPVVREPGKTLFPISRVQKIIKADKVYRHASFHTYEQANLYYIRKFPLLQRMQLS